MNRISTPFGFHATASEVTAGIDMSGKRVIVTGGASGIGVETARALASAGAQVTLAVRDLEVGKTVAAHIAATTGNQSVQVRWLDLADQDSIRAFVTAWDGPLHVLINNAGIMAVPTLQRTREGWEMQFATNYLGHFALTLGLHDALASAGDARIVSVSSSGHLFSPVVFDDMHFAFRPYEPFAAYGQSKTANVLLAVGATARWARDGITANALMPGAIATNLQRHTGGLKTPVERRKTPEQGAATSVLLATSPMLKGIGGRYFEHNQESEVVHDNNGYASGVAPYALDAGNAERLWIESERIVSSKNGAPSLVREVRAKTHVGFIGLGDQGAPMARAVAEAGYSLLVWARRPESLKAVDGMPHTVCATPAELGAACDIVALALRDDSDVRDVLVQRGLLASMKRGAIVVNHGTGLPQESIAAAGLAAPYGVAVLDAPVSGGRPAAEAKKLTTIVGGDEPSYLRCQPVFATFSASTIYMGPSGSGQLAKLLNNALTMTNLKNAEDVLGIADALGVDIAALLTLLRTSSGSSVVLQAIGHEITPAIAPHLQGLMKKDIQHFADAVRARGVDATEVSSRGIAGARGLVAVTELVSSHMNSTSAP